MTTPAKKAPAKRAPAKPKMSYTYRGVVYRLKTPNPIVFGELAESESLAGMGVLVAAYVVKGQRDEFRKAMIEDEDLTFESLWKMSEEMSEIALKGLPTAP